MNSSFDQWFGETELFFEALEVYTTPVPPILTTLPGFYDFNVLSKFSPWYNLSVRPKRTVVIERNIVSDVLMSAVKADWNDIKSELEELLRSYDIPTEFSEQVMSWIKENIKSKLKELPNADWLIEILTKLYIRLSYMLLRV